MGKKRYIERKRERNPGPVQHDHNNSTRRDLRICHLNMQSMKQNKEKLKHVELELCSTFDIITVSDIILDIITIFFFCMSYIDRQICQRHFGTIYKIMYVRHCESRPGKEHSYFRRSNADNNTRDGFYWYQSFDFSS